MKWLLFQTLILQFALLFKLLKILKQLLSLIFYKYIKDTWFYTGLNERFPLDVGLITRKGSGAINKVWGWDNFETIVTFRVILQTFHAMAIISTRRFSHPIKALIFSQEILSYMFSNKIAHFSGSWKQGKDIFAGVNSIFIEITSWIWKSFILIIKWSMLRDSQVSQNFYSDPQKTWNIKIW